VKYLVFGLMLVAGVPLMAWLAMNSAKARGWLVTLLIVSTALSNSTKINFVSMEWYRGPDRGFEFNLTDLVAWALIIAVAARYPDKIRWAPYNTGWLAALFCFALISAGGAAQPLYAAFSLLKWARGFVIFWAVVQVMRAGFEGPAVWRGFMIAAVYVVFLALKQKYLHHMYRVPGPFDHSNTLPLYINQFLPVVVMLGLCDPTLTPRGAAASVLVALGLIAASQATFSRLGMLLSIGTFMGTIAYANIRLPGRRVRIATAAAVILVCIGGALAAKSIMERVKSAPESSEEDRNEFNMAATRMADDRMFGVGPNNFPEVLTKQSRYSGFVSVMEDEEQAGVCHHIYNLTAAEMGYGAKYVFIVILLRFLGLALIPALRRRGLEAGLLCAFALGAVALHISGFYEWVFRITPVTFMYSICAGLAVGLVEQLRSREAAARPAAMGVQA
jgi:hypothetical protein